MNSANKQTNEAQKATLKIELNVECPECLVEFDLFETSQNEEWDLYRQVLNDSRLEIAPEERLKTHTHCPNCSNEFEVKGVIW